MVILIKFQLIVQPWSLTNATTNALELYYSEKNNLLNSEWCVNICFYGGNFV